MRSKKEFAKSHREGDINLPIDDIIFGKFNALDVLPKNITLEYYFPLGKLHSYVKRCLYDMGFFRVISLGDTDAISSKVCVFND